MRICAGVLLRSSHQPGFFLAGNAEMIVEGMLGGL